MARWIIALLLSSSIVLVAVPVGRHQAYRHGWFERSSQTQRRRSQRRPTHGGLVLAVALAAGALVAGPSEPAVRAVVAAAVLAVVAGTSAEQGMGARWWVPAGQVAAAIAVPAVGVRAELTGSAGVDGLLTALVVLGVIVGLRSTERSDGTMPAVAAIAASAFLTIATRIDDPVAPVAAAIAGAGFALVAQAWPPATVRLGAIGPTVLGAALAATAIELDPGGSAVQALAVPVLTLATVGAALLVPMWDRRLRMRGISAHVAIPIAAIPGAWAATRLANGDLTLVSAAVVALVPPGLLAVVGLLAPRPRPDGWAPRRGRQAAIAGLTVLVLLAVGLFGALSLWSARRDMHEGREFATAGLDAAREGNLEEAQHLFETADVAFAQAADRLAHPVVRLGDLVPGLAQNLRSARTLADVGGDLSGTAVAVAERAGADDLQVVDGRFPVEAARDVSAELGPALETLRDASARLDRVDARFLASEVRDANADVAARIADATVSIEVAAEATRLAPSLLGADGDRRWMVAVLTPSEQRGAGGLAGDYAELRAVDGDIELVESLSASELNQATDRVEQLAALPAIYRERYGGFRAGRFWQNLSATPDVPTFAEAVAAAYPLTEGGGPVDGVVVIDPYAIAALLELTGPIRVHPWPVPITSENAARMLLYGQYNGLSEDAIDDFQGDVVDTVIDALTSGPLPSIAEMAATLGPQIEGGHLRVWSPDGDAQALFERVGADGRLGAHPAGTDFIQLVTQNDGENKIDFFLRRALTYEASFNPATGALDATATVTISNTAPNRGRSSYIIGEVGGPTLPGENELEVTLYSPHKMVSVTDARGRRLPVALAHEQGLNAVTVFLEVPRESEFTIVVTFDGTLRPTSGTYQLLVGRQPAVVPDRIEASVVGKADWLPEGSDPAEMASEEDAPARLEVRFVR